MSVGQNQSRYRGELLPATEVRGLFLPELQFATTTVARASFHSDLDFGSTLFTYLKKYGGSMASK